MNRRLIVIGILMLAGCASHSRTTMTATPTQPPPDVYGNNELDRIIQSVIGAPDAHAESIALARLHDWMTEHRMIYHVAVRNAENNQAAPAATESRYPLRVTVEIYHGDQLYRTFDFIPRDNRNLTALGLS